MFFLHWTRQSVEPHPTFSNSAYWSTNLCHTRIYDSFYFTGGFEPIIHILIHKSMSHTYWWFYLLHRRFRTDFLQMILRIRRLDKAYTKTPPDKCWDIPRIGICQSTTRIDQYIYVTTYKQWSSKRSTPMVIALTFAKVLVRKNFTPGFSNS